jgi:hypothetical protein
MTAILLGGKRCRDHQNVQQSRRGTNLPTMVHSAHWRTDLLGSGVVRLTLDGQLPKCEIEGAIVSAVRLAVANAGVCLLIDAAQGLIEAGDLLPLLAAWSVRASGRPAVLLLAPQAVDSFASIAASLTDELLLNAICVSACRAEERAREAGCAWLRRRQALLPESTQLRSLQHEPDVALGQAEWRQAASPSRAHLH